jgi:hypothetical protein
MRVPYGEGIANHTGPESCVGGREAVGETLTGEHAGRVLSREKLASSGTPTLCSRRKAIPTTSLARDVWGPARSETLGMHAKHLAREPGDLVLARRRDGNAGRTAKSEDARQ